MTGAPDGGGARSLVDAARPVARLAAARAADADREAVLSAEVVSAVVEAGFARHFVPRAHGGAEGTFLAFLRASAVLGEACGSTAWFASLAATMGRVTAWLPQEGRKQIWQDGPDTLIAGSLLPQGTFEKVPGGWRIRGRWPYVSSCTAADWALLLARPDGGDVTEARFFALPREAYAVEETWASLGMRATGSHTVVVREAVVPEELSFPRAELYSGTAGPPGTPYSVPLRAVTGLSFAAPALGTARGAAHVWTERIRGRLAAAGGGTPALERAGYDLALSRSVDDIEMAALLLERVAGSADETGARSAGDLWAAAQARGTAKAAELLLSSGDRLLRAAGTECLAVEDELQRRWRDLRTVASHGTLRYATKAAAYAACIWSSGLPDDTGNRRSNHA
ncbi:acyl-CoA dehydrogenase family protein [Streptomyces cinerochromogenes]|uniref:acyl-CoA dehydrogenase family protein n=1 Tax=Streptomyces cinerochromogenes TaxID=66422 RepID=UPI0036C604E5